VTVVLAPPLPLPQPPGSVAALGGVLDQLVTAGAATGLTSSLLQPVTVLTGWQGADATVAAGEVGAALAVAADLQDAVAAARGRLSDHHELWLAVRARVADLREEQRARFADAGVRLAVLVGTAAETGSSARPAEAVALVESTAELDAAAAAEHRALLEALAAGAAGAAGVLAAATRPFGSTGTPGEVAAVTARLAGRLPGWGEQAMADLGRRAADELTGPGSAEDLVATARRWLGVADVTGFADALVDRLGAEGVTWLLAALGDLAGTGEEQPVAALLAAALGGTAPGQHTQDVLAGVRLDPLDPDGAVDRRAVAMGLVLGVPGVASSLAASWGRQLLDREARQGARAGAEGTGGGLLLDPVAAALTALARSADGAAAAQLLADPSAWTTLLSRQWPGGADPLATVVGLARTAPGAGQVARSALLALGQGLAVGSSGRVLVDRGALRDLRPAITALVAGRPEVVLPVLGAAVTGADPDVGSDTALRGLGYLVSDATSAKLVTAAVRSALQAGAGGAVGGAVAGAHVAVLEYGQRLRYALDWSQAQSRAVDGQIVWTLGISGPTVFVPGGVGELAGAAEGALADALDLNGDVEIGADTGVVRTAEDAVQFAGEVFGPTDDQGPGQGARSGFDRAAEVLGGLGAPQESLLDRLGDLPFPDPSRRPRRGG
jgi:hypothetical protein